MKKLEKIEFFSSVCFFPKKKKLLLLNQKIEKNQNLDYKTIF